MAKLKTTQLDIDATAAIKAGMSYGYYIANVKPCATLPREVTIPEGTAHTCLHCGKIYYRTDKYHTKFCGEYCRNEAKHEAQRRKKTA